MGTFPKYRALAAVLAAVPSAHALTINLTYDPSVATLLTPTDVTKVHTAMDYTVQQYQSFFSDPITLEITVAAGTSVGLGQTSIAFPNIPYTWSQIKTKLTTDKTTANDNTALTNMTSDPTGGANFFLSQAQSKALGVTGLSGTDGIFTFGSNNTYAYDPNNRQVVGAFDFIGVAEHEISEIMGRVSSLGNINGGYVPGDLYRYTAPGTHSISSGNMNVYFSIDNGTSNLRVYNGPGGGDLADWANGQGPDAYNAFTGTNVKNDISAVDMKQMDVIGYDLVVPEPTALLPLSCLAFGKLLARRRSASRK